MAMEIESLSGSAVTEDNGTNMFHQTKQPIILKFEDVVYKIKTNTKQQGFCGLSGGKKAPAQQERTILKGISGSVLPGEMLAMLGPSGSGKTTLLTALGGRLSGSGRALTGSITYNGASFSSSMKHNMGFVTQDDVLYPNLTVAETLLYTALLRLPRSFSRADKTMHAEAIIAQLGLTGCRNHIIGGGLKRGVSGGERKRVCIGQEMLINPGLLLLDEPTSGLDSTTALKTVSVLGELAKGGRTVVMTIHQPSSRLFYMFHKVLLLSDGNALYWGKGSEAMTYFSSIGYVPSAPMNPADFLLDLANGISSEGLNENRTSVKEALVCAYNGSLQELVKTELRAIPEQYKQSEADTKENDYWGTTWWEQFTVLLERGVKERRHEAFSTLKIAQVLAGAILPGIIWWQSGGKVPDQVGLLFNNTGFWAFFSVYQAIFTFPQERLMLTKERSSGMYRLSSYFISRTVGDLPMELALPTIYTIIVYWMAGLKHSAANFFMNIAVVLLSVLVNQGFGFAMGSLVMDVKKAVTSTAVMMLAFMLGGGFYVQNAPSFMLWIKYISFYYYNFKLQLASQFSPNETYQCGSKQLCRVADIPSVKFAGLGQRALAVGILFVMFFGFRLVAYLALMKVGAAH